MQLGLDLGFFKDRITLTTTYIRNRSSNQLINYSLPSQAGQSSIMLNYPAIIQNSGWEFALNTTLLKTRNFSWTYGINMTVSKNEVVDFPGIENTPYRYNNGVVIGQPLGTMKAFRFLGVDPATGVYTFEDSKGNVTKTPDYLADATKLVNTTPTFFGGFTSTLAVKKFQLDFCFSSLSKMD